MKHLNANVVSTQLSVIKKVLMLAAKTKGIVSLAWGLPLYGLDDTLKEQLKNSIDTVPDINKYAPFAGLTPLRLKLIERLKQETGTDLDIDSLVITAGAIEGLFATLKTILSPGDEVIVPTPAFTGQLEQISLMGAKAVEVPLQEDTGWSLNIGLLQSSITDRTKAIIITSPNNPTGSVYSKEQMDAVVEIARKYDLFILSDETYSFLSYGQKPVSLLSYGLEPRHIVVRSFSKEYALTGIRTGYLVAHPDIMQHVMKVHDASSACVSTLSQHIALAALEHFPVVTRVKYQNDFATKRSLIMNELRKYSDVLSFTEPAGAFYIMPKYFLDIPSVQLTEELVSQAKIAAVPGSGFGDAGEYHMRLSFAGKEDEIVEGVRRIGEYLRHRKGAA